MAKSRMVNTRVWNDSWVSQLDPIEKLLFIYLLTNEHTDICGIYELPLKIMAVETGIDRENLEKVMLPRFAKHGKVLYLNGWVALKNFIKHQSSSPKVSTGIKIGLDKAPNELREFVEDSLSIDYPYPIDSLSHPNTNSNTNSNSNPNTKTAEADGVNPFIELFSLINPSFKVLFARKPQRAAAARLLALHDFDYWKRFLAAYQAVLDDRFCPKATTPTQLEENLGKIEAYARQRKQDKKVKII